MRITDSVTAERLSVDEAYERFFDGFYNLGRPSEIFQRTGDHRLLISPDCVCRESRAVGGYTLLTAGVSQKLDSTHSTDGLWPPH